MKKAFAAWMPQLSGHTLLGGTASGTDVGLDDIRQVLRFVARAIEPKPCVCGLRYRSQRNFKIATRNGMQPIEFRIEWASAVVVGKCRNVFAECISWRCGSVLSDVEGVADVRDARECERHRN